LIVREIIVVSTCSVVVVVVVVLTMIDVNVDVVVDDVDGDFLAVTHLEL
jgi:hypothetical protein